MVDLTQDALRQRNIVVDLDGAQARLSWQVGRDRRQGRLVLPEGLAWSVHRAGANGAVGWYSPRFGVRVPSTSLVGRGLASSSTPLVTELELP